MVRNGSPRLYAQGAFVLVSLTAYHRASWAVRPPAHSQPPIRTSSPSALASARNAIPTLPIGGTISTTLLSPFSLRVFCSARSCLAVAEHPVL